MPYISSPDGTGVVWSNDPGATYAQAAQAEADRTGATIGPAGPQQFTPQLSGTNTGGAPSQRANANTTTPGGNNILKFKMPDGSIQTISVTQADVTGQASTQLQQLIRQGGMPIDPNTGRPMQPGPFVNGGQLWQSSQGLVPLNVTAGFGWLPGQQQAIANLQGTQPTTGNPTGVPGPPLNIYQPPGIDTSQTAPVNVSAPTTGGMGNFITPAGTPDPLTNLSPSSSWQTILSTLMNAGLNKSAGSNNLIDLATNQLTNAQNTANSIYGQEGTVNDFIKSMIDQANQASTTRDTGIQTILQNIGNGQGGTGLLQNASTLLNNLMAGSTTGNQPGNVQFDPAVANAANNAIAAAQQLVTQGQGGYSATTTPGLSPAAQSALGIQLTQGIPAQFNGALSQALSQLQASGALGGATPGSQEDLTRVLAPIYAGQAAAYSNANTQGILQNAQLQAQQLQQARDLGAGAINSESGAANTINSQDALAIQQLLSNRSNANNLINSMNSLIGTFGNIYNPTQGNTLASSGIGDLINLINSGTNALNTGNNAVNAATGAYAAGNQPLATATSAGQTFAQNSPASFANLLLSALLSTGAANAGGIAKWLQGIFGGGSGGNGVINLPGSTGTGDTGINIPGLPPIGSLPPIGQGFDPNNPGGSGGGIPSGGNPSLSI